MSWEQNRVGKVFHYFPQPQVAAIKLDAPLAVGDKIRIIGANTDIEIQLDSMEIDRKQVESAGPGDDIGIKVPDRVRPNDVVYKVE